MAQIALSGERDFGISVIGKSISRWLSRKDSQYFSSLYEKIQPILNGELNFEWYRLIKEIDENFQRPTFITWESQN